MNQPENQTTGGGSVVNPVKNRRATIRYHCAPATTGKVYAPDDVEFQIAWIMDLSATGAGFIMNKPLPIGLRILLSIRAPDRRQSHDLYAQIVRNVRQVTGDYFIGCKFVNALSNDELDELL